MTITSTTTSSQPKCICPAGLPECFSPDPTSCNKFFRCVKQEKFSQVLTNQEKNNFFANLLCYWMMILNFFLIQECPNGLGWNSMKNQCDWPSQQMCGIRPITKTLDTNTGGAVAGPRCNCPNMASECYYADPRSCNKFTHCFNKTGMTSKNLQLHFLEKRSSLATINAWTVLWVGFFLLPIHLLWVLTLTSFFHIAYAKTCPSGLTFNIQSSKCDWPTSTNCGARPITETFVDLPSENSNSAVTRKCQCPGTTKECYTPDQTSCNKFYHCING